MLDSNQLRATQCPESNRQPWAGVSAGDSVTLTAEWKQGAGSMVTPQGWCGECGGDTGETSLGSLKDNA